MNSNVSTKNSSDETQINITDFLSYLVSKLWIIVIATAVLAIGGFLRVKFFTTASYSSSSKILIMNVSTSASSANETNWSVGKQLTTTSPELITRDFCNEVAILLNSNGLDNDNYNFSASLGMPFTEYYKSISGSEQISGGTIYAYVTAYSDDETCMVTFKASSPDAKLSAVIVNAVTRYFESYINDFMNPTGSPSASLIITKIAESGKIPGAPSNINYPKNMLLFGVIGAAIACVVLAIVYIFNDKLRNPDDIERVLGITTLGMIPEIVPSEAENEKKEEESK